MLSLVFISECQSCVGWGGNGQQLVSERNNGQGLSGELGQGNSSRISNQARTEQSHETIKAGDRGI